jgi:flagellar hook-associated protein 3 FlgL
MRISTKILHDRGSLAMQKGQARLMRTQEQLSTGRRVNSPADDPIAAASAMRLADTIAKNKQFLVNQAAAKNTLQYTESIVGAVGDSLQDVRERLVQGASSTLTDADRRSVANDLRAAYQRLLELANSRDQAGNYLFAGSKLTTQPFADDPAGALYYGDQGVRSTQVSPSRTLTTGANGAELFLRVKTGNGIFTTQAAGTNTGTGVVDQGSVFDPSALTLDSFQIVFAVAGSTTTYDVVNTTTATTVSSGNAFVSGTSIQIAGKQVAITGSPANGDTFSVTPSANQNVFTTLNQAIATLERPVSTLAYQARFSNEIAGAMASIDQAIEQALVVRSQMGSNLREITSLEESTNGLQNALQAELSGLVDLDYAQAISEFARQQQALEAARDSYARTMQRTLFDII